MNSRTLNWYLIEVIFSSTDWVCLDTKQRTKGVGREEEINKFSFHISIVGSSLTKYKVHHLSNSFPYTFFIQMQETPSPYFLPLPFAPFHSTQTKRLGTNFFVFTNSNYLLIEHNLFLILILIFSRVCNYNLAFESVVSHSNCFIYLFQLQRWLKKKSL